ncbi:MAG: AAA family ATPase [Bacteroidales bacterium]|nr:AAA family ATPase [Bacteroidales bacterium]
MDKTILERMYSVTQKMADPNVSGKILINAASKKKAGIELKALRQELKMTDMQILMLAAILQKSSRYRIDGNDVASFLGMQYLKFLSMDDDMEALRKRGYIRIDKEGNINVPKETLKALKSNKAVEPEPTTGLTTGRILGRMKRLLEIRDNDELTTEELFDAIRDILKDNPDTSISRTCEKYIAGLEWKESVAFFVLIYFYWFRKDDMLGWHDMEDYFDEDELDCLKDDYTLECLSLQQRNIIEYVGRNGLMDKEYFHIKDDIKDELFDDLGGMRKKEVRVSASRKLLAAEIGAKELFYNPAEQRQVEQLKALMSAERLDSIRAAMKEKGMRSGFTCLFYGAPGTGKTETVYQVARECGRDIFIVDVSQIKSMWVGESEKNIKDVFDRYRQCVAAGGLIPILLFNEADAIFGIRKEGADWSVDKMENSIQNIILQEMENLDGILIATTNLTCNLDKAFERRFLYKIRFEKPSVESRGQIWRSMLPELSELEAHQLSVDFDFSGGQIENIVRKKTVRALISGQEPTFAEIRELCQEEGLDNQSSRRRIGF